MWEIVPPRIQYKDRVVIEKYSSNVRIQISLNIRKKLVQLNCEYCNIYKNDNYLMVQFLKVKQENSKRISKGKISLPKYVVKGFLGDGNGTKAVEWRVDKGNIILDLRSLR